MSKAEFVKRLGVFLASVNDEVKECYLKDNDTAMIVFSSGYEKRVNIRFDSNMEIIIDVVKEIIY